MAELADARGSGPRSRKGVEVQVLLSAPKHFKRISESPNIGVTSAGFSRWEGVPGHSQDPLQIF